MNSNIFKSMIAVLLLLTVTEVSAQKTAMDFNKADCNGTTANLFADLDAGKAVVLFYYMPSCGSCPPPARTIQTMANNINALFPGMVKGYAFPFQNSTTCAYSKTWVSSNGLPLYAPMDSGAAAVAHYGGFGMPTVVLVGGKDHRVMFSTLSFSNSDTTIMRDSILALFGGSTTAIQELPGHVSSLNLYPNPAADQLNIRIDLTEAADLDMEITDLSGKRVGIVSAGRQAQGNIVRSFNTAALPSGIYNLRIHTGNTTLNRKFNVVH